MSDVLARARAHFDSYKARPVEIAEWLDDAGKPTVCFIKPLTMGDRRKLDRKHADDANERMVTIVIRNAVDADGEALFEEGDRRELLTMVSGAPLQKIAFAASGISLDELIEDEAKN